MSIINEIVSGVENAEKKVVSGVEHLFSKQHIDEALAIAKRVADIGEYVLPYVQELATIVPGSPVSPALVAAAEAMDVKIDNVLAQASSAQKSGTLVQLAGKAGLSAMETLLQTGTVTIGGVTITEPDDLKKIPQNELDSAVQNIFTLYVALALAKLDQPTTPPAG